MNKVNSPMNRIKMGLGIALIMTVMGCAGFWGTDYGGGYYGGAVIVPGPYYGYGGYGPFGFYETERGVHEYSRRGFESRGHR